MANAASGKKPGTPPASRRGSGEIFVPGILPQAPDKSATPCLCFDSLFESGNLSKAIRLTDTEYDLLLSGDSNSRWPATCVCMVAVCSCLRALIPQLPIFANTSALSLLK